MGAPDGAAAPRWTVPMDVSPEEVVEGVSSADIGTLIPAPDEIPREYHEFRVQRTPPGVRVAWMWSLYGLPGAPNWRPGIDHQRAKRHLRAILNCRELDTVYKIAAAGYLLDLWCEDPVRWPLARVVL